MIATSSTCSSLVARVRQRSRVLDDWGFADKIGRGLGVSALLSGPPGTGKTMIAGLVANELGLDLYQVDLSKIVSKYIGEPEKQLASWFDGQSPGTRSCCSTRRTRCSRNGPT